MKMQCLPYVILSVRIYGTYKTCNLTEWSEDFGRDSEGTGDSGTDSY